MIERLGTLLDEPLADPAFLPTVHLARLTRESVTVALGGDGGDELLCGYPTALALGPLGAMSRLPRPLMGAATRIVNALGTSTKYGSPSFLAKQFFRGAAYPTDVAVQIMMGGLTPSEQRELTTPAVSAATASFDPYADVADLMEGAPAGDAISRLIYHHSKLYLAGQTLVKMDRGTMAHGVEARAPFLDPDLIALTCAMPSSLKLHGVTTKYILKRALKGRLPDSILDRRKQGFGVPLAQWFRGPLRPILEETLNPDRLRRVGLFDPKGVDRLIAEHMGGRQDHRKILWTLLAFERWRESYLPNTTWN
jgi:asparagine synthase (glutamine-hydrolysing)